MVWLIIGILLTVGVLISNLVSPWKTVIWVLGLYTIYALIYGGFIVYEMFTFGGQENAKTIIDLLGNSLWSFLILSFGLFILYFRLIFLMFLKKPKYWIRYKKIFKSYLDFNNWRNNNLLIFTIELVIWVLIYFASAFLLYYKGGVEILSVPFISFLAVFAFSIILALIESVVEPEA